MPVYQGRGSLVPNIDGKDFVVDWAGAAKTLIDTSMAMKNQKLNEDKVKAQIRRDKQATQVSKMTLEHEKELFASKKSEAEERLATSKMIRKEKARVLTEEEDTRKLWSTKSIELDDSIEVGATTGDYSQAQELLNEARMSGNQTYLVKMKNYLASPAIANRPVKSADGTESTFGAEFNNQRYGGLNAVEKAKMNRNSKNIALTAQLIEDGMSPDVAKQRVKEQSARDTERANEVFVEDAQRQESRKQKKELATAVFDLKSGGDGEVAGVPILTTGNVYDLDMDRAFENKADEMRVKIEKLPISSNDKIVLLARLNSVNDMFSKTSRFLKITNQIPGANVVSIPASGIKKMYNGIEELFGKNAGSKLIKEKYKEVYNQAIAIRAIKTSEPEKAAKQATLLAQEINNWFIELIPNGEIQDRYKALEAQELSDEYSRAIGTEPGLTPSGFEREFRTPAGLPSGMSNLDTGGAEDGGIGSLQL